MDPDATVAEMRKLAHSLREECGDKFGPDPNDVERLCELVDSLDGWLSNGGFVPQCWAASLRATP